MSRYLPVLSRPGRSALLPVRGRSPAAAIAPTSPRELVDGYVPQPRILRRARARPIRLNHLAGAAARSYVENEDLHLRREPVPRLTVLI